MYLFKIKADEADIDLPNIRALITGAAIVTFGLRNEHNLTISIVTGILILAIAALLKTLTLTFKVDSFLVLSIVCVLTIIANHEAVTALILFFFGIGIRLSYISPVVEIRETGVKIKRTFHYKNYIWENFNNIILKDNLLTLDFKNNKVVQLEVEEKENFDVVRFNEFCGTRIHE